MDPFWSPDSRYIAFFADAKLKKIEHTGGPVQILCDALATYGGAWSRSGEILVGGLSHMQKIASSGGALSDLAGHIAATELYPVFLPDGRHYLAARGESGSPDAGVWLNLIDGPETRRILPDLAKAEIVEPPPGSTLGQILFTRSGTLLALPFDMKRLESAGEPVPLVRSVVGTYQYHWLASGSTSGVLAYIAGQHPARQFVWRDRQGKVLSTLPDAGNVVAISPDGKRIVGDRSDDTWVLPIARGAGTRMMFGPGNANPIWSPDGRFIAHSMMNAIGRKPADGAGSPDILFKEKGLLIPKSWSPDGRFIIFARVLEGAPSDLFALDLQRNSAIPIATTPANEDQGQFSPDGHWVAYTSNESGVSEIYVVPFPPSPAGGKWLVSRGGGVQPRWRRDGKELFYISPDSKLMAAEIHTQPVFQSGIPRELFPTDMVDTGIRTGPMSWDVAPDGRFLFIADSSIDRSITVVLNWRGK